MRGLVFLIEILLLASAIRNGLPLDNVAEESAITNGRTQYESLIAQSKVPKYGSCWKTALESLHGKCEHLTADSQMRLAILFTNCLLESSGLATYECANDNVAVCTRLMNDKAFTTFSTFFQHTQNMCHFLASRVWREQTQKTVNQLLDASHFAVSTMEHHMEENRKYQEKIISSQELSLENELKLLDHRVELAAALESSITSVKVVKETLDSVQDSSDQQRAMFGEIFEQLVKLRSLAFGEVAGVFTMLYYIFTFFVVYMLTSIKRTESARFSLMGLLILCFGTEKLTTYWNLDANMIQHTEEQIYARLWIIRRFYIGLSLIVLSVASYRYRDINQISYQMLLSIYESNQELRRQLLPLLLRSEADEKKSEKQPESCDQISPVLSESLPEDIIARKKLREQLKSNTARTRSRNNTLSRRKLALNDPDFFISPDQMTSMPREAHTYNLRNRSSLSSPASTKLLQETPEAFEVYVHHMADVTRRNSKAIRRLLRTGKACSTVLSSDDEI